MAEINIDILNIEFADKRFQYFLKDEQGFISMFVKSEAIQWILCNEVYYTLYKQGLVPFFSRMQDNDGQLNDIMERAYELVPSANDKLLFKLMKLIIVFGTIAELIIEKQVT